MRITTQQLAGNKLVHIDVGLMQPPASDIANFNSCRLYLLLQMIGSHRTNFFKHLATVLVKQPIFGKGVAAFRARNVAKV